MPAAATPAPAPQSRSSDSGAAKALAMVGAMMAMAQCAQMMNEARKAQAEGDKKSAQMYQMMAMQQCQQGAQNMANAKDNGKQKDDLQKNQTPMATLPAQKSANVGGGTPSDKVDQAGLGDTPSSGDPNLPDPELTQNEAPAFTRDPGSNSALPPSIGRPADETIVPNMIDNAKLTGNESAKGVDGIGDASPTAPTGNFASFMRSGASGTGDDLKKKSAEEIPLVPANTTSGSKGGGDSYVDGGAAGGGKDGEGGGLNLTEMMNNMFGGGQQAPAQGFAGAQGIIDYTPTPTSPTTGRRMNIFEAASELYRQAKGKKIRKGKFAEVSLPKPFEYAKLSK